MYAHSYQDLMLARSTFKTLPAETMSLLARLDFRDAERSCPLKLPIGWMMHEATKILV
jgi:hypothetical protein